MTKIFISYRRQDSKAIAGRIFDRLEARFGRDAVFMDIDSIPPGVDFHEWLNETVANASVVLALIGRGWVDARDELGLRRLENPNDFVRIEIEAALARKITVIPLLIDGASPLRVEELPASLLPLTRRNAAFLDAGRDFNVHMARVIAALEALLKPGMDERSDEGLRPEPRIEHASAAERDWEREKIDTTEDVEIITAYVEQYANNEPLWAMQARRRLKVVEGLIAEAEKQRSAQAARDWALVNRSNERAAIEGFLDAYPESKYTSAARTLLARLVCSDNQKVQEANFRAEGRIHVNARLLHNDCFNWFLPGAGKTEWFKDIEAGPEMVAVPSGKFTMGSPDDEPERLDYESPQHEVTIPKPFAIGRCAVTRGQFAAFVTATGYDAGSGSGSWRDPGLVQDDSHPIVYVNWDDAKAYIAWLSKASGAPYRLPSEAEWEYACRAGSVTPFWWGVSITLEQANYDGSAEPYTGGGRKGERRELTVPAKHFEANPWGLYQVHGNVWEWCEDAWHGSYSDKPERLKASGTAWTTADTKARVIRGGAWLNEPQALRSSSRDREPRDDHAVYVGFRVVRTLNP